MNKIYLVLLSVILSACATEKKMAAEASSKNSETLVKVSPLVLEEVLTQKSKDSADVIKWLKKCSEECQSPDKEIAKDLYDGYSVLFSTAAEKPKLNQLTDEQKNQLILGQSKIRKSFLKILEVKEGRDILETAYRELSTAESMYAPLDIEVQETVNKTIERLKKNPKTLSTAWYMKAISTSQSADNVLEMVEYYKNCITADRVDLVCRGSYEELVRFYERPRCQEPNFNSSLSFVSDGDVAKKTVFDGNDLLETTLEAIGPDHWEIWFTLKTFSAKKLEEFTSEKDKKKLLIMTLDGKELAQASVNQKITDGSFRMIFQNVALAKEAFEKTCKKPNPEKIPDNLKL